MTTTRKVLIVAALAFAAALTGCGGVTSVGGTASTSGASPETSSSSTQAAEVLTGKVGQTFTYWLNGKGNTANVTVNSVKWVAPKTGPYTSDTSKHGMYLVVDVTLEGVSGSVYTASSLDWSAQDAKGYVYESAWDGPVTHGLASAELKPGQKIRGEVAFDAAEGSITSVRMTLGFSGEQAVWTVK